MEASFSTTDAGVTHISTPLCDYQSYLEMLHLQFPMNMGMLDLTFMHMMMVTCLMLLCGRKEIEKRHYTAIISCSEIMMGDIVREEEIGHDGIEPMESMQGDLARIWLGKLESLHD